MLPIWSKWAWERTMSPTLSAVTPSSPSSRTGEIHQGMSNLDRHLGAAALVHEAAVDQHVALAVAAPARRRRARP